MKVLLILNQLLYELNDEKWVITYPDLLRLENLDVLEWPDFHFKNDSLSRIEYYTGYLG